jgi:hypothetical protein
MSDAAHPDVSLEIELDGVELKSVIVPQDFLPGRSSDWARLRFAGPERGKELVVGMMVGVVNSAEKRAPSIEGGWRGKARSIIWLHGSFEMTARLDADELTRAFDRDPELANAHAWAAGRGRYPGLVKDRVSACDAILPWAFTQHAVRAFDAGAKMLEFDIEVCLWATGKVSPLWSPYEWLIVSWVDGKAYRMRAGRPMMISPREVLRPTLECTLKRGLRCGPQKPADAFCPGRRPSGVPPFEAIAIARRLTAFDP